MTSAGAEPFPWQQPAEAVPPGRWDVVVVGAGPAGSLTALHLARQGYRVLLLDRERFPRDKTCGDLLIADALQALERTGLLGPVRAMAHEVDGFSVFSPSRVRFELPGRYLMLKRRRLDAFLARHAAEAGATFARGKVDDIGLRPDGTAACSVAGCPRRVAARGAVPAAGAAAGAAAHPGPAPPSACSASPGRRRAPMRTRWRRAVTSARGCRSAGWWCRSTGPSSRATPGSSRWAAASTTSAAASSSAGRRARRTCATCSA